MRICYFGWSMSPHVWREAQWFATRGHKVHLVSDQSGEIEGVNVHVVPSRREYDARPRWERIKDWSFHDWRVHWLRTIKWARNLVRNIAPDIVHSKTLWFPGYLGAFVGAKHYVITPFNGDILWRMDESPWHRLRTRVALWRAALVTADSNTLLERCHCLGVKKSRTCRIVNGTDLQRFVPVQDRRAAKRWLGFEGQYIVLAPRGLWQAYNPDTVIRAIPLVHRHISDVLFVFLGGHNETERLEQLKCLATQVGVTGMVIFLERVPWEQMPQFYQAADIMVSVATKDQSPASMREAMACGAVPVVSDLPGLREWVRNGENGYLVNPTNVDAVAEAIINLLTDRNKWMELSQGAVETIRENGDQDVWWHRLEGLYLSLLDKETKK